MSDLERVLSLDLEQDEYLYRIQRGGRVVYVLIESTDIIPREDRTDSSRILRYLREVSMWQSGEWSTLTLKKTVKGKIECGLDQFAPHRIDPGIRFDWPLEYYNILSLHRVSRISDRLSRITIDPETPCRIVKIARFGWEVAFIEQEIIVYQCLMKQACHLAPKPQGYVFEESSRRVVGFIIEEVIGRHPGIEDVDICRRATEQLHLAGIVHKDLNKYNMIIDDKQMVRFIDFETSITSRDSRFVEFAKLEIEDLPRRLKDSSGSGQR